MTPILTRALLWTAAIVALAGCTSSSASAPARDTTLAESDSADLALMDTAALRHVLDSAPAVAARPHAPMPTATRLSPLADSIADRLTFMAKPQRVFLAASRGKRLLVDLGRVDFKPKTPAELKAYDEAVRALSPVRPGDAFEVRGRWGADSGRVVGYTQWNGRIAATLALPPRVDSLARLKAPLAAIAVRTDSLFVATDSCRRDSVIDSAFAARLVAVRDSLLGVLQADTLKLTDRLRKGLRAQRSQVTGCFAGARVMLFVSQSAGDVEYYHEIAAVVSDSGRVTPLHVADLRFKVHEALEALDVDGDGVDDVAVRGLAPRAGGTVILRYNAPKKRLEYIIGGFAWESY